MGDSKWLAGTDLPSFLHSRRCSTSWSVPPSLRGLVWSPCMCPTLLLYISQPPDRSPTNPACMCINICLQYYCTIIILYIFKTYPPSRRVQPDPHFPLFASFYQVCICPLFSDAILGFVLILDFLLGSCFSYAIMSCQRSWYYYFLGFVLDWFISWHVVDGMEQCKRGEFVGEIWEFSHVCFVDFWSPLSRFCSQLFWAFLLYVTHLYNVSLCQNTMIPRPF